MAGVGSNAAKTAVKKYQKKWERQFTWLRFDGNKMWCEPCTQARARGFKPHQRNSLATDKGSTNFRLSTLERHENGKSSDHKRLGVLMKSYPKDVY